MQVSARVAFSVRRTTDASGVTKKELTTPAILRKIPMTLQLAQCKVPIKITRMPFLPCVRMRVISIGRSGTRSIWLFHQKCLHSTKSSALYVSLCTVGCIF